MTKWEEIEREAINDPVLHRLVSVCRHPHTNREEALMAAVLWLARNNRESLQREVQRLMNEPAEALRSTRNTPRED